MQDDQIVLREGVDLGVDRGVCAEERLSVVAADRVVVDRHARRVLELYAVTGESSSAPYDAEGERCDRRPYDDLTEGFRRRYVEGAVQRIVEREFQPARLSADEE